MDWLISILVDLVITVAQWVQVAGWFAWTILQSFWWGLAYQAEAWALSMIPEGLRGWISQDVFSMGVDVWEVSIFFIPFYAVLTIVATTIGLVAQVRALRWVLNLTPLPGVTG